MKSLNLSRVAMAVLVAAQLVGTDASASVRAKKRTVTTNKELIKDPYYQIKGSKIKELTDEEAMEFINVAKNEGVNKDLTVPNIRPKPPGINSAGEIVLAGGGGTTPPASGTSTGAVEGVIMIIDRLIAIGQKIIPTIEKGRPVVTNNPMASVSVLPRIDSKDPVVHDMGGWSIPSTKHYKISFTNGFNSEVVSFVYSITFQYGGDYGGKGKYLTGIRASARNIVVKYGFDLDASSQLIQISNVGTAADVIAAATVEISYTVKNFVRVETTNESFFVSGDGKLYKLD